MRKIIIGTRGSELALKQAHYTKNLLENKGFVAEIKIIKTQGDEIQKLKPTFFKTSGKGIFTKELEDALLSGEVDLAVHSLKDLPVVLPKGLQLGGISEREDPREIILIKKNSYTPALELGIRKNGVVVTSSLRRLNQIHFLRPDLEIQPIRGNVPTRIKKFMENSKLDAIVLALAGLKRLEIPIETDEYTGIIVPANHIIPAPAQGALGWEIRENDHELKNILHEITHEETRICVETERNLMHALEAGCHAPLGIYTEIKNGAYHVYISYAISHEKKPIRISLQNKHTECIQEKILKILKNNVKRKIFISKSKNEWPLIHDSLTDAGHQVFMQPLIKFEQVYFKNLPEHEAVFFSSPRCVEYYFKLSPNIKSKPIFIGCMGEGTKRALLKYDITPDFIGKGTDTVTIMRKFHSKFFGKKILIPVAETHNPEIEKIFDNKNLHFIVPIYRTIENPHKFEEIFDIVVLTSSSNASSYFKSIKNIPKSSKFIAIGKKTKDKIKEYTKENVLLSEGFDEIKLLEAIYASMLTNN